MSGGKELPRDARRDRGSGAREERSRAAAAVMEASASTISER